MRFLFGSCGVAVTAAVLLSASLCSAAEIVLKPGENYRAGELSVICVNEPGLPLVPFEIHDCQHWDDYEKSCLQESVRFVAGPLSCVEDCQHWDSYEKVCRFATECRYESGHRVFVRKECARYDDFEKKCLQVRERVIRAGDMATTPDGRLRQNGSVQ